MNPLAVSWAPGLYTKIGWLNLMAFCEKIDTLIYVPNENYILNLVGSHSRNTEIYFNHGNMEWSHILKKLR